MSEPDPRIAELIGGALAHDLSPDEERELDGYCQLDPQLRAEVDSLLATSRQVSDSPLRWVDSEPSPDLEQRISALQDPARTSSVAAGARRRSWPVMGAAAAFLIFIGALGGPLVQDFVDQAGVEGPPGTLGAVEDITFGDLPSDTEMDAAVVAHTWGTETRLELDGAEVGQTFEVILVSEDGSEFSAGTFLGSEQPVVCQLNAAVLREDVSEVRIERPDGSLLGSSELTQVTAG